MSIISTPYSLTPLKKAFPQKIATSHLSTTEKPSLQFDKSLLTSGKSPSAELLSNYKLSFKGTQGTEEPFSSSNSLVTDVKAFCQNSPVDTLQLYDRDAKKLGILMANNNSITVEYEKGAMEDLLSHDFVKNLNNGIFAGLGMTADNTDVKIVDTRDLSKKMAQSTIKDEIAAYDKEDKNLVLFIPTDLSNSIDAENSNIKLVFFHENGEKADSSKSSKNSDNKSKSKKEDNDSNNKSVDSHFGSNLTAKMMTSKPKLKKKSSSEEGDSSDTGVTDKQTPYTMTLDKVPAEKAKDFLKTNMSVVKMYLPDCLETIKIPPESIDFTVNKAVEMEGDFPGKAIELLRNLAPVAMVQSRLSAKHTTSDITPAKLEAALKEFPSLTGLDKKSHDFKVEQSSSIRLSDMGGINLIEEQVRKNIIDPLLSKTDNTPMVKGMMIEGEGGSGRTMLAQAIAGETGAAVITHDRTHTGDIHDLFAEAKEAARDSKNKTAVIVIDNIDKWAPSFSLFGGSSPADKELFQILDEVKDLRNNEEGLNFIVAGITEDAAAFQQDFMAADEFDFSVHSPKLSKNKAARKEFITTLTKDMTFKPEEKEETIEEAAKISESLSGAEIKALVKKTRQLVNNRDENKDLTINDFYEAMLQMIAGPIKADTDSPQWFNGLVFRHECAHAVTSQVMYDMYEFPWQKPHEITLITLDSRGSWGGAVLYNQGENGFHTYESVIGEMVSGYAGLFEEREHFGGNTHGPYSDIKQATRLATFAASYIGLGPNTGLLADDEMFKPENKQDMQLMSKTAGKISEMIVKYHQPFIEEYAAECEKNFGKGGNTMSAKNFRERLHKWQASPERQADLEVLQSKVKVLVKNAKEGRLLTDQKTIDALAEAYRMETK